MGRPILYGVLLLFYLLHSDLWWWDDASLVLGVPIGLLYHIGYCLAAALLMAGLVKWAWPAHLERSENES